MFGMDWNNGYTLSFVFALLLALWAVFNIVQNDRSGPFGKALWSVFVLFVPYVGFIAWLIMGPKAAKRRDN
jgi:hypothetical protein